MSGIEDKPENYVTITYTLTEKGHKTKLLITQENIPDEKQNSIQNKTGIKYSGTLNNY